MQTTRQSSLEVEPTTLAQSTRQPTTATAFSLAHTSATPHWNRHSVVTTCNFPALCRNCLFSDFTFTLQSVDCICSRKGTNFCCDRELWPMTLTWIVLRWTSMPNIEVEPSKVISS